MFLELFFILIFHNATCNKNVFNIAGVFENNRLEEIFRYAIGEINSEERTNFKLNLLRTSIYPDDPYFIMDITCDFLKSGVVGVFGPMSRSNMDCVKSVCDNKEMPHILTNWAGLLDSQISFYPQKNLLTQAYMDIINGLGWTQFTLLYTNSDSLVRLSEFIEKAKLGGLAFNIENLDRHHNGSYSPVLQELKKANQRFFMLDCRVEDLYDILIQILQNGMLTSNYKYFFTNLDAHSEDLEPISHTEAHITGIRLVNPARDLVQNVSIQLYSETYRRFLNLKDWILSSEIALIIDSVHMFSNSLKYLNITQPSLDCSTSGSWEDGSSIVNKLKSSSYNGLTGLIKFGADGYRSVFELNIFEVNQGIKAVGNWNTSHGLNMLRDLNNVKDAIIEDDPLKNRHFVIITTLVEPYAMKKVYPGSRPNVNHLEGFVIDLIHELSLIKGFSYTFIVRDDKNNGQYNSNTEQWTGMIGDLLDYKTDLAISDLTITYERESFVDFTTPFMVFGVSILYRQPVRNLPSFSSFAYPIANILTYVLASCIGMSVVLFVLGRISPSEWQNPYPYKENPEYLISQLTFKNCVWFTIESLMMQGSAIKLRSVATRMVAGLWWFCTLLVVSFYTANLVSILTTQKPAVPFSNFKELLQLAEEGGIQYGAKSGGSTANLFRDLARDYPNSDFGKAWKFMTEHKDVMVSENKDGIEKVEVENYAFFMESSSLKYETQRRCNLIQVGGLLNERAYGIAMRKDEPYRNGLSAAILELHTSGKIDEIRRKWWSDFGGDLRCGYQEARPLDMEYFEGIFWLNLIGIIVAVLITITKVILRRNKLSTLAEASLEK